MPERLFLLLFCLFHVGFHVGFLRFSSSEERSWARARAVWYTCCWRVEGRQSPCFQLLVWLKSTACFYTDSPVVFVI